MLHTLPLPIPVPTITLEGDTIKVDRAATELARQKRDLGWTLMVGNDEAICCSCKGEMANMATIETPEGFRWGGMFCHYCLGQGRLAKSLGLIIDQVTCEVVNDT